MKARLTTLVATLLLMAAPSLAYAQKMVILIRHAERDPVADDALTAEGRARAEALTRVLKDSGLKVIVRSDTIRTRDTAAPTATQFHIEPRVIPIGANLMDHVKKAAEAIRASGDDAVVLYVGHSNTVKPLLVELGYQENPQEPFQFPGEDAFGNLVIFIPAKSRPVVARLHYSGK